MKSLILAAGVAAAAMSPSPVKLKSEAEIRNYWIFDFETTRPLLEEAGLDLLIPPELAKKHKGWSKKYEITIDSAGAVVSARCLDCPADDPLQKTITRSTLLNRYKPAPGNQARTAITAPMQITLTPFGG